MEHDVQLIKFVNGEEIICELVQMGEYWTQIKNPFAVIPSPQGGGITLIPWCIAAVKPKDTEIFEVRTNFILMKHVPFSELANSYLERISGLSLKSASSGLILD